jgi:hypothetical protein
MEGSTTIGTEKLLRIETGKTQMVEPLDYTLDKHCLTAAG